MKIIEVDINGVKETGQCAFCDSGIPTNHYCLAEVLSSNTVLSNDKHVHICGKAFCVMCKEKLKSEDSTLCEIHLKTQKI